MDLNIEDLNRVVSTLISKECLDSSTEKCFKRLILYTSENDVLLSQLAHILVSTKSQASSLFKSLIALHYTINNGDQKFIHYLSSNNLNFINLDKAKNKFNGYSDDYLNFLKKYLKYLQQKINVHKFVNGETSWLSKLIHKNKQQNNLENCQSLTSVNEDSVLQHDIIGEQLMKKISYVESQIDYLLNEFTVDKLNLLFNENILNNVNFKNKLKLIEYVFVLIIEDVIHYANYYHDVMNELVEQFESMNKKHCKDAIEIYRKLPEKVQVLRDFLENLNENLIIKNSFQSINIKKLKSPSIEIQKKMEQHWNILESKPKRKNSERRKEKSRYAARARRSEENDLLNELCELVPLPEIKSLDKASVMRLAIAFINTKQFIHSYAKYNNKDFVSMDSNLSNNNVPFNNKHEFLNALETSNLMLILLTLDGDLVFISPNVNNLIGLKQTEILGMSIFDFVHPCDHEELKSILSKNTIFNKFENFNSKIVTDKKKLEQNDDSYVSFMVRIKSTLNNKTKSTTLKSASYKMASFSGYCKTLSDKPLLVLSVNVLLPPCAQLQCAGSSVFVTKHSPDLKFINIDDKLKSLIKYNEKDLIGSSYFQYIHAADASQLFGSFQKLLSKGEVETGYYRLLCKTGGYFWIQTKASLLTDHSTQKPQAILCIHYLLSEIVCSNLILSSGQCSSTCKNSFETGKQIGKENKLPDNTKVKSCQKKQLDKIENRQNKNFIKNLQSNLIISREQNQFIQTNQFVKNFNNSAQLSNKNLNEENSAQQSIKNCLKDNFSNHFVEDCKEFDAIFEKVKLKEQLKEKIENEIVQTIDINLEEKTLNNNYFTSEPLFNTLKVFEPLAKEDLIQCDPSYDNSPAIYTSSRTNNHSEIPCEPLKQEIVNDLFFSVDQQPLRSTNTIFKPLTADIDSGFLVFTEDNVRLLSDDQADKERLDLTHLAPQAGDSCVQLDFDLLPPVLDKKISEMVKNMGVFQETNEENLKDSYLNTINENSNQKELTNQNNSFKLTKISKKDELELEQLDENLKHFIAEDNVPIVQIKRQKLNNDNLKLYSYLSKNSIRDNNDLIQTSNDVLNSFLPNETQFLDYDPGLETNSEVDNNVLIDDFENSIEINQGENFIENKNFVLNNQINFNNSKENDEIQQVVEDLLINEENLLLESKLIESNKMKQLDLNQFNQVDGIIDNAFTNQSSILDSYLMSSVGLSSILNNDEKETNQTNYQSNLAQKNLANNLINESMNSDQNLTNCVILNENTFNFVQTPLQNDPFLSFSPGYKHAHISKQTSTIENLDNSTIDSNNQNSNLPKIFLLTNNQENKKLEENLKTSLSNHSIKQISLNNQADGNLFQFNNSRSNSPSDYIKLDQKSVVDEQIDDSHISTVLSGQCVNNSQKKLSSQKLNGEDLLFSLTSEDLNDVANSLNYFPLLNSENLDANGLTKDKTSFNGSSSVESSDSLFCSSVWDSPPSSSSNSSLNNDLDLPFILDSDSNELTSNSNCNNVDRNFIDSEFPFLSEDSILNSFVNSNLSDIINGDEFFSDKTSFENNMGSFFNFCDDKTNNSIKLKKNTLSTDSNLAKLLKEKLPTKLPKTNQQNKNVEGLLSTNNFTNQNKNDNSTVNKKTYVPISTNQTIVDNKNPLVTRKYTIQNLNVFDKNNKKIEISKNCIPIAHSIKIIDPVNTVQVAGNTNVKYLLNSISASLPTNFSTTQNQSNLNINIPPFNCTTLTNVSTASNLNSTNTNTINIGQASVSTAKSFIIKSVGGKVANGILYTPITTNSNGITYASNLSTINNQTLCTDKFNKAKVIQTSLRTNTPNLLVSNRKILQKRPYSSMSISMSSNNVSNAKDLYSIDLVPKNINSSDTFLDSNLNDALDSNLSLDPSKKPKINSDLNKNNCLKLSSNSVLMNLLVNGEDLSNGYLNINSKNYNKCKDQLYKTQQQSVARIA